jgi:hypothetical protein
VMFLRLCTRAPCTAIVVRAAILDALLAGASSARLRLRCRWRWPSLAPFSFEVRPARFLDRADRAFLTFRFTAALATIQSLSRVEESQFLHLDVALAGEMDGY